MDRPAMTMTLQLNANPLPSSIFPIRHVWYQSQIEVVVDLLVKRVRGNDLTCDVQPDAFTITFRTPDGVLRSFGFERLRHEILPSKSTVQVFPTRVEIRLRKKEPGIKWITIDSEPLNSDVKPESLPLPPSYQGGMAAMGMTTGSGPQMGQMQESLAVLPPRAMQVTMPHTFHSIV
ncbi:hypothetical protein M422DRAFT_54415 [Sphaerobolus stellatus SS14]|uniref:CS domain-containing protein n=1 Tax=Sphaerobolus stellatus (strain SS14) TaxID=990650 RepID=A0A0C9UUY3_SPHS4|nr:hypothetical protein M422DRAFT_54415 [Sphaerobolus stellatus SS14]